MDAIAASGRRARTGRSSPVVRMCLFGHQTDSRTSALPSHDGQRPVDKGLSLIHSDCGCSRQRLRTGNFFGGSRAKWLLAPSSHHCRSSTSDGFQMPEMTGPALPFRGRGNGAPRDRSDDPQHFIRSESAHSIGPEIASLCLGILTKQDRTIDRLRVHLYERLLSIRRVARQGERQ